MEQALIELIPTMVLQAPSLAGMVFALVILANHNRRLLTLLERMCCDGKCEDEKTED